MIEIERLQKNSQGLTVLDLESLRVRTGQIVGLVGPQGSGIEELFELVTGRSRPTAGEIRIDETLPWHDTGAIGVLFADDGLYQQRTVRGNLQFFARLYGIDAGRVEQVLSYVGLEDQGTSKVEDLATGLARRLAFGRAVLHQPRALILRDPFARCDQASITLLQRLIREQAEEGAAVLILADDDANLLGLCHYVHRMQHGQIVETAETSAESGADLPFKIPVKGEGSVALVNPAEVLFATAEEGKATLQTVDNESIATQFTLSELESRLARRGFFRAHRSYLVNLQHVTEVIPFTRDSYSLRIDDTEGTLIPLSKSAASELRELLGY
ncbi:MAG: LytTR family transcriptional regulator DNA-binding domain-containing protein [Anaerolineales bacterium]|jgi:ABC-2 type transport system ATP-binding protein